MVDNILYLNNTVKECGVFQVGNRLSRTLAKSTKFNVIYEELNNEADFRRLINLHQPKMLLFNYQHEVMPWLSKGLLNEFSYLKPTNLSHAYLTPGSEFNQFSYYISLDTGAKNDFVGIPNIWVFGRLLWDYVGEHPVNKLPTFGTSGFPRNLKNQPYIVKRVNAEYDSAVIRLHLPFGHYTDHNEARQVIEACRREVTKPGIDLQIDTEFYEDDYKVIEFLAKNDLNIYAYVPYALGCGTASSLDLALSARRPIAVSYTNWFRHVRDLSPSIIIESNSLQTLLDNGTTALEPLYKEWSEENCLKNFENIFERILDYPPTKLERIQEKRRIGQIPPSELMAAMTSDV